MANENKIAAMCGLKILVLTSIIVSCLLDTSVFGQPTQAEALLNSEPANMFIEPDGLLEKIRFPGNEGDVTALVRCETHITARRRYEGTACYSELESNRRFENAILRAAPTADVAPAVVNGERRNIWTIFSVLFIRRNDAEAITLYPNHLLSFETYGDGYISPQRYYSPDDEPRCGGNRNILLEHTVHPDGSADTVHVEGGSDSCGEQYANYFSGSEYIPATVNGEPIEVTFREWIF